MNPLVFITDTEFYLFPYLVNSHLTPYSQVIDQHFPGGFLMPVNFATLGFTTPLSFFPLHLLLISIMLVLIYKITKKIISPVIFILIWPLFDGLHLWIDTFTAVFYLAAFYAFTRQKYLTTGLILALALFFKQTALVPIVLLSGYLLLKKRAQLWRFLTFPILMTLFILIYFHRLGVLNDFIYWTITFNTKYSTLSLIKDLPKWLVIFTPILFLIKKYPWCFFWLAVSLVGFIARPDLVHLQPAAPFVIILFSLLPWPFYFLCLLIFFKIQLGNVSENRFFDDNILRTADYLKSHTTPGQEIFILGAQPHIYMLSDTLPAGKYFFYQFPWYLKVVESKYLEILKSSPPSLIVYDPTAIVDKVSITVYAKDLVSYMESKYYPVQSYGNLKIYAKIQL